MSDITKKTLSFIVDFVTAAFTDFGSKDKDKCEKHVDAAIASLKSLVVAFGVDFAKWQKVPKKGSPSTVAHNADHRFYLRVIHPECDCPMVCKPVFSKQRGTLYGYRIVPDSERVTKETEMIAFLLTFDPENCKKHDDAKTALLLASSRQVGEDITNNFRQKSANEHKEIVALDADAQRKAELLCLLSPADWASKKSTVLKSWENGARIVAYVDALNEAKEDAEEDSDSEEETATA